MAGEVLTVGELLWWLWLLCVADVGVLVAGEGRADWSEVERKENEEGTVGNEGNSGRWLEQRRQVRLMPWGDVALR